MITEAEGAVSTDAEDTAAVLAIASGEKTYLEPKPEAQAEAPKPEGEDLGDDAPAAAEPEAEANKPKPKQTVQERIDELTRARREAERDRDFYREQALRKPEPAPEAQPTQTQGDGRPDPAKYELGNYDPQFIEDLTDWKANDAAARMFARQDAQRQVSDVQANFQTRTKTLFPDGPSDGLTAFLALPTLPTGVSEVIAASDIGPKLAEHLGDNPAELQRLAGLTPTLQARELTRLETRLSEPPKVIPKTATDAPEPPPQARGSGGKFTVAPDTDDFAAFERQHMPGG